MVRDANYILAHTSEITHIPNGRQYTADMRALEAKQPAPLRCVFSLDMANLKILNEEKLGGVGHEAADKVLEYFARELEQTVNSAASEMTSVVLHNSYHVHSDEFCAVVASTMSDADAFQSAMKKLAERIAAIRFDSADEKQGLRAGFDKTYPETYFRVGALCTADANYNAADKLQELVGVEMKADYPDRRRSCRSTAAPTSSSRPQDSRRRRRRSSCQSQLPRRRRRRRRRRRTHRRRRRQRRRRRLRRSRERRTREARLHRRRRRRRWRHGAWQCTGS